MRANRLHYYDHLGICLGGLCGHNGLEPLNSNFE